MQTVNMQILLENVKDAISLSKCKNEVYLTTIANLFYFDTRND